MKSSNTSFQQFRRAAAAVAVILATGATVAVAQSNDTGAASAPTNSSADYNATTPSANDSTNGQMSNMQSSATDSTMNQSDMSNSNSSHAKLSWSDRHFINKVAESNQQEIQIAQLAQDRASNPDVQNFAQKVLQDHQKMGQDLQNLAQQENIQLKTNNKESHAYKKLASASGNDFDTQFVKHMVSDHKNDVKEFKDRADDTKNPELKSFAQNAIPTLQEHLQMAQNLQSSIVPTGRMDQSSGRGNLNNNANGTNMTGNTTMPAQNTTEGTGYSSGASSSGTTTSSTASTQ
ncbi:MAG TPA: DUF4142 domain-containing protein [Opitutaceae bacterium]|nr:DUF4142 domain-containing protein [Opitutaceae bacterium]